MAHVDMRNVAAALPRELTDALRTHGFSKVASLVTGVDASREHAIYQKIGTELFLRKADRTQIFRGLRALAALQE